jgi:hypothetical protein
MAMRKGTTSENRTSELAEDSDAPIIVVVNEDTGSKAQYPPLEEGTPSKVPNAESCNASFATRNQVEQFLNMRLRSTTETSRKASIIIGL